MQVSALKVAGLALLLGLAACGKSSEGEYPDSIRVATYDACLEGFKRTAGNRPGAEDAGKKYCGCMIDGLQKSVPVKDFTAYDRMLQTNEQSPERQRIGALVDGVVQTCLAPLKK